MTELYRSRTYSPDLVARRYVAWRPTEERFVIYEVNGNSLTLRELASDGKDIPPAVQEAAKARVRLRIWPNQVLLEP